MSLGGLTGAGGGTIMGTPASPSRKQPDTSDLVSSARSGLPNGDGGKLGAGSDKADRDRPSSDRSGLDVPTEKQSQELRAFDAVQGRPSLGDEQPGGGQEGKREGSFVGCAAGAARDVVVGTVKGLYDTAKDAGGAMLDKAGVDGFEGHSERTADRVSAVVDGGKNVAGAGIDVGGAVLDKAGVDGFEGHSERTAARGAAIGEVASDEWAEFKAEVENGDSCALGDRVGTGVGVAATAVGGGALYKGGKLLAKMGGKDGADGPDAKLASPDVAQRYDDLKSQGHGPQRHGPNVTTQQLEDRVLKGHDPMTGGTTDGVTGGTHRQERTATRIKSAEDFVAAEGKVRGSQEYRDAKDAALESDDPTFKVRIPLDQALGEGYADKVEGRTRIGSKGNPEGTKPTDLENGDMIAAYRFKPDSEPQLITMYPVPGK
ncbi:MAG: hypothetical protein AAGA21_15795 [Pseudomonadota bacterium]